MGTVKTYIKIPQGFAEANDKAQRGLDKFAYGETIHGDYFVDVNTLNTHADLFPSLEPLEYIEIDYDDVLMYDEDGNITTPNYVPPRGRSMFNFGKSEETTTNPVKDKTKLPWWKRVSNWVIKQFKNVRNRIKFK